MEDLELSLTKILHALMIFVYIILLVYLFIMIFSFSCLFLVLQRYFILAFLAHSSPYISSPLTSSPIFHQQRPANIPFVPLPLVYPQAY